MKTLSEKIENYFENQATISKEEILKSVQETIELLNKGAVKIINQDGSVNQWIKKTILLLFKFTDSSEQILDSFDKIGLLPYDHKSKRYRKAPGAFIRNGVFIGDKSVIMPSYINIGAYIGEQTMIDINASIGSCAQIGKNCHISAGVVIGGVLEPVSANPVVIEDNCFIGANSAILEGMVIREGSIIASGVILGASTKILLRDTGEILPFNEIPQNSVIVPGSYRSSNNININCAVLVKNTDPKARSKTSINEILRSI